jgi:hypothetical protein
MRTLFWGFSSHEPTDLFLGLLSSTSELNVSNCSYFWLPGAAFVLKRTPWPFQFDEGPFPKTVPYSTTHTQIILAFD